MNNFLVSVNRKAWIAGAKRIFIAEPFIYYAMEKDGELPNYEDIQVAPALWQTRDDLEQAHNFVEQKYHKYVPLLSTRLNTIHNRQYITFFWKKCLSLGFLRHITFTYQIFQLCETYFRPEQHDCRILSEKSYNVPNNFNEHRDFFQYTAYGQEQLFSLYVRLFYPKRFATFDDKFDYTWKETNRFQSILGKLSRITLAQIRAKLYSKLISQYYARKNPNGPCVGLMGCFFTPKYTEELVIKSKGRICPIPLRKGFISSLNINLDKRNTISEINDSFDKFDRFFFASMLYCIPKEFVEDFDQVESYYKNYFNKFRNLKYIVSETWTSDTFASMALAIAKEEGIKHIYNEHNYLSQHFLGKDNKYIFKLVDLFITLGWDDTRIPNVIKGASLFDWVGKKVHLKEYDILFIDGIALTKFPEFNAAYGDAGPAAAPRYLEFNKRFFMGLSYETLNKIVFRPYPIQEEPVSSIKPNMMYYDYINTDLIEYLRHCKTFDNTPKKKSKFIISKSKLVIVNYLSTSYIESIMTDVPTIFFWNKANYHLDDEYLDFYDLLISVGICQTDPVQAARFVEQVMDNPEEWWQSASVRKAREIFLSRNMGSPQLMLDYLLKLADLP